MVLGWKHENKLRVQDVIFFLILAKITFDNLHSIYFNYLILIYGKTETK